MPNSAPDETLMAAPFPGKPTRRRTGTPLIYLFIVLRHKRQPMCSRLVCDSGVMNVTAVIRASAVSVLDIHGNDVI